MEESHLTPLPTCYLINAGRGRLNDGRWVYGCRKWFNQYEAELGGEYEWTQLRPYWPLVSEPSPSLMATGQWTQPEPYWPLVSEPSPSLTGHWSVNPARALLDIGQWTEPKPYRTGTASHWVTSRHSWPLVGRKKTSGNYNEIRNVLN